MMLLRDTVGLMIVHGRKAQLSNGCRIYGRVTITSTSQPRKRSMANHASWWVSRSVVRMAMSGTARAADGTPGFKPGSSSGTRMTPIDARIGGRDLSLRLCPLPYHHYAHGSSLPRQTRSIPRARPRQLLLSKRYTMRVLFPQTKLGTSSFAYNAWKQRRGI